MNGTSKQIMWAKKIKQRYIDNNFDMKSLTTIGKKAIDFILSIDDSAFWIDNRHKTGSELLHDFAKGRLRIKGNGFSHVAKISPDGEISVSYNVYKGRKNTVTKLIK